MATTPDSAPQIAGQVEFVPAPARLRLSYTIRDALRRDGAAFDPWVEEAVGAFEARLPIPPSCAEFRRGGFFRLKRHLRSICYAPAPGQGVRNVFCIKGMEPYAPDFEAALDRLATYRRADSGVSLLEHFVAREGKLPGCVTFDEARAEARIAAAVHERLSADGEHLARLPLPVLCVRLPDSVAASAARAIADRAPASLRRAIEARAAGGLGAYVYWYPAVPLRAVDLQPARPTAIAMSEGWIGLAERLLRAGFVPTTAASVGRGQCCNKQNSVIDGGFVDMDSVVAVSELSRPDLFVALQLTIWEIAASILHVLGHPLKGDASAVTRSDHLAQAVLGLVRARLAQAGRTAEDPRVPEYFQLSAVASAAELFAKLPVPPAGG